MHYVSFKKKYSLNKVLFHIFAVLFRQRSILKLSSMTKNLLVYIWVLGSMFISLAYDSVFVSFLSFVAVNPLKDISELSTAVLNGDYHCDIHPQSTFNHVFEEPNRKT